MLPLVETSRGTHKRRLSPHTLTLSGLVLTLYNGVTLHNRPFPHSAPVSKHKEMRTRLGWTISYKSLYFVHPSLDLMPLFTGMRERSIDLKSHLIA